MKHNDAAAAAETPREAVERESVLLHMPVDVRNLALVVIAVIASAFALQWAKAVFIPLLLGVMFSYALTPLVDRLEGWRLPRAAGAGLLLAAIVSGIGWGAWSISDDANALIETLPEVAQKLRRSMQKPGPSSGSTIEKVQQAAAEIEQAAEDGATSSSNPAASANAASAAGSAAASSPLARAARPASASALSAPAVARKVEPMSALLPAAPRGVTRVVVEKPRLNVKDYLWTGTLGLFTFLGQVTLVIFIAFFLLASGNTFRRKMVKLAGPRLSQKKITVQALDEIHAQIQQYLLVQLATSVVVGVLTGLAFFALGLNHSLVWAILAGVTNLIPYLGSVVVGLTSAVVGVVQFESLDRGLIIGASS
ncbi:MAG: AI-2E family transporter, partial [Caldimonas sp.]